MRARFVLFTWSLAVVLFIKNKKRVEMSETKTTEAKVHAVFLQIAARIAVSAVIVSVPASMALAKGVHLNHIARETPDVNRLAAFYQEVLGFERIESPEFGDFQVVWLSVSPSFSLHLIERNPQSKLPESPHSKSEPLVRDPRALPRGHHISFGVSNFDSFVAALKEKGVEIFEKTQPDGKTKQVFFFDPDGNGLEVGSW